MTKSSLLSGVTGLISQTGYSGSRSFIRSLGSIHQHGPPLELVVSRSSCRKLGPTLATNLDGLESRLTKPDLRLKQGHGTWPV